jgi:hypothetical protein
MHKPLIAALMGLAMLPSIPPPAVGQSAMPNAISEMPAGYNLQAYDECGSPERQPHVLTRNSHTYSTAEVNADQRVRTVAWDWKHVDAVYENLDPNADYVLAVTYANEAFNNRVQSLWAGSTQIHGPHPLPKGGWERLLFRVPRQALAAGKLSLQFRMEAQVNSVVSMIELWAPLPSPKTLRIVDLSGLIGDLTGKVLDLRFDPAPAATVTLYHGKMGTGILPTAETGSDGTFRFDRALIDLIPAGQSVTLRARKDELSAMRTIPSDELRFQPLRYRPIPTKVAGLKETQLSLDGVWRMRTEGVDASPGLPLDASGWSDVNVPGQWKQQGHDVPQDKHVAMAREFSVPAEWAGQRVILRFDAIHAGTHYRVNDHDLGYSENLFTPVEWDITDLVHPGKPNRLDLDMVVDTPSERLSYSSGYAFHSLGGIDRSVRLFALPPVYVRDMKLDVGLDKDYRDGLIDFALTVESKSTAIVQPRFTLYDPEGKRVSLSYSGTLMSQTVQPIVGRGKLSWRLAVSNPAKWSAEKPTLYRLVIDLSEGGKILERIERRIGFRKIEVVGSKLLVNGHAIKIAGACHHETDPLTGRAGTARHAETDVRLMKDANLNWIRTSHYPPCRELLDAADRIGMYVEVEAPFCWVGEADGMKDLRAVLAPTSAMVDYNRSHPSVIVWSLANESAFNRLFEVSNKLVKDLDPTRPTTFNNPDPKRICDIANLHYAPMPYDAQDPDDPRPLYWGEHWFPLCHEQADVRVNPGLRELWAAGSADPASDYAKLAASSYDPRYMRPGVPPGAWTHVVHSSRVVGGSIWAALDEPFYFPDGSHVGYAWVHGFWGLIDAWRRTKPEWWLSKMLFSPVWFPARHVEFTPGQASVRIPVENRYAFTDLNELTLTWQLAGRKGILNPPNIPPGASGDLTVPVPPAAQPGATLILRASDPRGRLIAAAGVRLGAAAPAQLPASSAGPPQWHDDGRTITLRGAGWSLALDRATLRFDGSPASGSPALLAFPMPHVTQFDFGDFDGPYKRPYAELPDDASRVVESVAASEAGGGLEIAVRARCAQFEGATRWTIDRRGIGRIVYDYVYSGPNMSAREVGLRLLLSSRCDTLRWRRWSEWGVYPDDSVCRIAGTAKARRDPKLGDGPEGSPPNWPWSLDQTELGTADFRSVKLNVYEASLTSPEGAGLRVRADADRHVRACLDPAGVKLHILSECRMGPVILNTGDHVRGECFVELLAARSGR